MQERGAEKEKKLLTELLRKQMEEESARIPRAHPYPYTTDYPVVCILYMRSCTNFHLLTLLNNTILVILLSRFHQNQSQSHARNRNLLNWRAWSDMKRKCKGKWQKGADWRWKKLRGDYSRLNPFWRSKT